MVYRLNFVVFFFFFFLYCSDHWLYIFPSINWPEDRLSRDVSLILLVTFQIVTLCFFIGFVKLEAIINISLVCTGENS